MATEEPQTLPIEQKAKAPEDVKDMAVDEPSVPAVNGHTKPSDSTADESATATTKTTDGEKAKSPSPVNAKDDQNRQAFAANNNLPEQTLSLSPAKKDAADAAAAPEASEAPKALESAEDVEMGDANGTLPIKEEKQPSPDAAAEKKDEDHSTEVKPALDMPAAPNDEDSAKPKSDPEPVADEKMDVDTNEPSDLVSTADGGAGDTQATEATQDTAATDAPAVSPKTSTQLPEKELASASTAENEQDREDRAASPNKVSRMREDDNPDEPASKRMKIEDPSTEDAAPEADSLVVANGPSPAPQAASTPVDDGLDDKPIAPYQNKLIRNLLASIKKTKNGLHFRKSVEDLWPALWAEYRTKINEPVDISLLEGKLREDAYKTYGEFKDKIQLLHSNAFAFNGPDHVITVAAAEIRKQVFSKLPVIDKTEEPVKPEKGKAQPTRHTEPRSATQARRQSQPQANATAATPKPKPSPAATAPTVTPTASSTAPTFALPPNGVPQIRRDSTREDGDRPKRPIHPPKNRDLDYSSKANRKKKLDPEQRFHDEVLNEIKKGKYFHMNQWFMEQVDPVALNIPTYFSVVKKPMDLGTMTRKNLDGQYKSSKDLEKDMRLIVHNAELFNGREHDVAKLGKELEDLFKAELAKKDQWMAQHYPQDEPAPANASAASPERSAPETEEESEAEGGDDSNEVIRNLQIRLNEEQDKLTKELNSKKPDATMIEVQQQMVQVLQKKLVEEKNKFHSEAKKPKPKKKKPTKSKPKPSTSTATASASKKGASSHGAAATKKSSGGSKKTGPKKRTIGQLEKAVIEEGISTLDGNTLTKAVEIIKKDTGQNENDDGEMELDIESLSQEALGRLYDLIHRAHPHIRQSVERRPEFSNQAAQPSPEPKPRSSTAPPKPKKNKPMNKHEQERKIEQLRELKAQLARQGSGSQEPPPTSVENPAAESSEEDSDSEEE